MKTNYLFKKLSLILSFVLISSFIFGQSVTATFSAGDISTEYMSSPTTATTSACADTLDVTLPAGAVITGVDVVYDMTADATNYAYMSEQRSFIRCITTGGTAEAAVSQGVGYSPGTYAYSRTGLTIANAITGGGIIQFEMNAFRTYGGSGCGFDYSKVDSSTWIVTVNYFIPVALDASIDELIIPAYALPNDVKAVVKNFGTTTLTSATVNWTIDGVAQTAYSWIGSLAQYAVDTITLSNYTFAVGSHTVIASSASPNGGTDGNTANDTNTVTEMYAEVFSSFPYTEDFENGGVIPAWWTNDASDAGGDWQFVTTNSHGATADHTSGTGYYALLNDYNIGTSSSPFNLISPAFDLSASGASYRLSYWAWIGADGATNPIKVYISSDGGATWNLEYTHDQTTTNSWVENTILLSSYTTSTVVVKFEGTSVYGYGTDNSGIDDFKVFDPLNNEMEVSEILGTFGGFTATLTDTLSVVVKNNGVLNQTNIPIKYVLDNGTIVSETMASLDAFTTDTFTFVTTFDGTVGGVHVLTAYTDLSSDQDNSNDTTILTFITEAQDDLGVTTLIEPVSSVCGDALTSVKVIVKNYGVLTQNNAPLSVIITDSNGVAVTLTATTASIASLATDTVDMGTFDASTPQVYSVMAYTSLSTDTIFNDNDTLTSSFVIAEIYAVDYVDDFDGDIIKWSGTGMYVSASHGKSGKGLYKNFYSYSQNGSAFMNNKVGSITANSSLVFDYNIVDWGSVGAPTALDDDKFYFMLSTDCGTTFDTIATIDSTNHTASAEWIHKTIDVSSYAGQEVIIKFAGVHDGSGDYYFSLDNIGIVNPQMPIDLGADTTICFNSGYALDATAVTGSYYLWTANNDTLAFTGAILNVDTAATYAVEVMAPGGTVTDAIVITTHAVTMVTFTSLDTVYCSTADPVTLAATPTGGTFTGNGVTGDSFDPLTSGLGQQIVTYDVTDTNGCDYVTYDTTFINEGPMVVMTADLDICEGDSTVLMAAPATITPSVFFSMYIEGSSNNKGLEIFNGTNATVNLDDYRIAQASNGNGWAYYHTFPAGATLAAGAGWVMVADQVSDQYFDTTLANEVLGYPSLVHFNGDDARALEVTTDGGTTWTIIDIFGTPDNDPGSGWDVAGEAHATKDHSLVRKSSIFGGSTDWNVIAGIDAASSQYEVLAKNTFTGFGNHMVTPPATNNDIYLWSTGETTSSIVVKPNTTTTYTVTVANTLCSDNGSVIVTVNAYPIVDLGPDQEFKWTAGSVTLDAGNAGMVYDWSTGETTQTVNYDQSNFAAGTDTTITVVVDNNGCMASDTIVITVIDDVSIDGALGNVDVSVFPNPNDGRFTLAINGAEGEFNMEIVNLAGQVVYSQIIEANNNFVKDVDISEFATGVYYIKLSNKQGVKINKLIIK